MIKHTNATDNFATDNFAPAAKANSVVRALFHAALFYAAQSVLTAVVGTWSDAVSGIAGRIKGGRSEMYVGSTLYPIIDRPCGRPNKIKRSREHELFALSSY